ncbi:transposase [Vitiosangium sp. GDMCC 1.1324]|uniref:transposase n=1 Tax=Vitiosangium sp. (strain GDMCC 1.1324) TaxID=2138576 RepID=UPI000D37874F|nr:hypothetical protein DAT35_04485 [Vitiosangium sp. GDMCC 1.1324]
MAACIPDARDPSCVVHTRLEQVRQRVYQMALGSEDCNDAHTLRHESALQVACDVVPHSSSPLSSQPTLCRLENAVNGRATGHGSCRTRRRGHAAEVRFRLLHPAGA